MSSQLPPLQIERLTRIAEFEALRPEWEALHESCDHDSIFLTFGWQYLWWKHYGQKAELALFTARSRGKLVGVLPAYVQTQRVRGAVPVRMLRLIGTGGDTAPDYLGMLVHDEFAHSASRELVRAVMEWDEWDVLRFADLWKSSALQEALLEAADERKLGHQSDVSARIYYAKLPGTFDEYLAGMHRDRRYTVRNTRRRFEKEPGARFTIYNDPQTIDAAFDRLKELHLLRWAPRDDHHAFASDTYLSFHRSVVHDCLSKGYLRLCGLEVDGVAVAMYYCYVYRGCWYYFQSGFDPAFERLRPGLVLMGYAINAAIDEGCHTFDMLRGEYDFKRQWAKETRETHCVTILRPTLQGHAWQLLVQRLPRWKRAIMARFART